MRHGAVTAGVNVPFQVFAGHAQLVNSGFQLLQGCLTLASADDFSNLGEEHVHAADGTAVLVLLHVEGLDVLGEIYEDDGLAEVLFYQVTLMLALEVRSPVYGVFELDAVGDGFLQNLHGFGVRDALEGDAQHASHSLDEAVVVFVIKELEIFHAVVQSPLNQEFHEFLGQLHVVVDVVEGHFGLYHPELGQVARGVGVLGPEGGAEGVDFTYSRGSQFAFQLSGNGEGGLLPEEVFGEVHVALLVQGDVLQVQGGYLEHVSGTLGIAFRNEGGVEIDESLLVEEAVDGEGHLVADSQNGAEGVGPQTHVGHAAEVFQGGVLFLEREAHRVALSQHLDVRGLDFNGLAAAHGLDQLSPYGQGSAGGYLLEELFVKEFRIGYYLYIGNGGAVVEGDELNLFVASFGADPALGQDLYARLFTEESLDFGSF